jgi:hypothetical protein
MIVPATLDRDTRTDLLRVGELPPRGGQSSVPGRPVRNELPPLAALLSAAGTTRAYVKVVLAVWGMGVLADVAELLASELVTNSLRASTTLEGLPCYVDGRMPLIWVRLVTAEDRSCLRIEVYDQAAGEPLMKDDDPEAESGRGLQMVDMMTGGNWGWSPNTGQPGKCVWVVLPLNA